VDPTYRSFGVARALLDCACLALSSTSAGCPSRRCVVPGAEIEFVDCCGGANGGQLTINLESVYASRQFPVPDSVANRCDAPYEVVTYSITILRCVPTGDFDHAASCEQLESVAQTTFIDQYVLREAIRCCLEDEESFASVAGYNYRWVLDEHPTLGPEGGCVGSTLRVIIGLGACHNCEVIG
jgi:hypothetical protein